jgi:uncharacterized protein DUF5916
VSGPLARAVGIPLVLASARATAQEAARPVARALRIGREEAPRIDGDLSEPAWSRAPEIGPLTQAEPNEGAAPTERTSVRIAYDERSLYLGIACFDAEPARIVATQKRRDADLTPDDRVEFVLDTFRDRRNAYFFQIGAGASIGDALVTNNGSDFNRDWDGIWEGAARITSEGWFAEIAIPFRTLAFQEGASVWGFNLERTIKRRREDDRWAGARLNLSTERVAEAGDLAGLEGMEQGIGLDLVPYLRGEASHARGPEDDDLLLRGGGDLFYRLTPGITATLTAKTDFAQTEVDERQVNLTRFPLFFPEKRRFFLEDAGIFAFESGRKQEVIPFFSRRIGLDAGGEPVPILGGAKVTGREGPWSLGVLGVETGAKHDLDEQGLFAARVRRNIGERSLLGVIATHGDPNGGPDNSVLGVDYKYTTTAFAGDRNLDVSLYGLKSWTEGIAGDDLAYGAEVAYPNDEWEARLLARVVQEDFRPALGFVQRPGTRRYAGTLFWNPRPHTKVRQLGFGGSFDVFTEPEGQAQTVNVRVEPFHVEMDSGDEATISVSPQYERLDADFDIVPGITIPEGSYSFVRAGIAAEGGTTRPLVPGISFETGSFLDGHRTDLVLALDWRPSGTFNAGIEYERNRLDHPGGEFAVRVGRLRAAVNFSPTLTWENLFQFDNVEEAAGLNSRVRWIVRPGQDVFLVLNQGWERNDTDAHVSTGTQVIAKIVYTLRF